MILSRHKLQNGLKLAGFFCMSKVLLCLPLKAELIAYDGFDYQIDEGVEFTNGGFGWNGPWGFRNGIDGKGASAFGAAVVTSGSLSYGNLVTSGNHIRLKGDVGTLELGRRLSEKIVGEAGTSTYISFLGQRVGPQVNPSDPVYVNELSGEAEYPWGDNLYPRGAAVRIFNENNGEIMGIGNASNRTYDLWSLSGQGLDKVEASRSRTSFSEGLAFVVVRVDHSGEPAIPDDFYMWVNPVLSDGEDLNTAEVKLIGAYEPGTQTEVNAEGRPYKFSNIAWISPFAGNESLANEQVYRPHAEMLLDELRIGHSWEAVVPLLEESAEPEKKPEIFGAGGLRIITGEEFSHTFVTDVPANQFILFSDPIPGLEFDESSGRLSGIPVNSGNYLIDVAAENSLGRGGLFQLSLAIAQPIGVVLPNLNRIYNGNPQVVTAQTELPGLHVDVSYNGLKNPPTQAGSYTIVAQTIELLYEGRASGILVISKANAEVIITNLVQTYNQSSRQPTIQTQPASLPVSMTYNGGLAAPHSPGIYEVIATVNHLNYQGSATAHMRIEHFEASLSQDSYTHLGGTGSLSVFSNPNDIQWTVLNVAGWLEIVPVTSGQGSTTLNYAVAANPGIYTRRANLTVNNMNFELIQTGGPVPEFFNDSEGTTVEIGESLLSNDLLGIFHAGSHPFIYSSLWGGWMYLAGEDELSFYFWHVAEERWYWSRAGIYPFAFAFDHADEDQWIFAD